MWITKKIPPSLAYNILSLKTLNYILVFRNEATL